MTRRTKRMSKGRKPLSPKTGFNDYVALAWKLNDAGVLDIALATVDAALQDFDADSDETKAGAFNLRGQILQKLGRLDEARAAHEEMVRLGHSASSDSLVGQGFLALGSVAQHQDDFDGAQKYYVEALRVLEHSGDARTIVQVLMNLATLRVEIGELARAEQILHSLRPLMSPRDPSLRAGLHGALGNLRAAQKRFVDAISAYRDALRDARRAADEVVILTLYQNIGAAHLELELPKEAGRWYRKGAERARHVGSLAQRITLERGAAVAANRSGDLDSTRARLETIQRLARRAGPDFSYEVARAKVDLAGIAAESGKYRKAAALLDVAGRELRADRDGPWIDLYWSTRLTLAEHSSAPREDIDIVLKALETEHSLDPALRSKLQRVAAEKLAGAREFTRASEVLRAGLTLEHDRSTPNERAWSHAQAGALLDSTGGGREATAFFDHAAEIYSREGDLEMLFRCTNDAANALAHAGEYRAAMHRYDRALALARRLHNREMIAEASLNRAETLRRERTPAKALPDVRRAMKAYRSLGDVSAQANVAGTLGLLLADLGRDAEAARALRESVALAKTARDATSLAVAFGGLAGIARERGQYARARTLYERKIALAKATKDLDRECEGQAGLMIAMAARPMPGWKKAADDVLRLAPMVDRTELVAWAFTESAKVALEKGLVQRAMKLFALSIGLPLAGEDETMVEATSTQTITVVRHLQAHAPEALDENVRKVVAAAKTFGTVFADTVRIVLDAAVTAVTSTVANKRG